MPGSPIQKEEDGRRLMSGLHDLKRDRVNRVFERDGWTIERQTGSHVFHKLVITILLFI